MPQCAYVYETGRNKGKCCEIIPENNAEYCYKHRAIMENRKKCLAHADNLHADDVFRAPNAVAQL